MSFDPDPDSFPTAARIKTDQYQFSPSSMYGNGYGYVLNNTPSSDFQFGTDNFTIEGWFRPHTGAAQTALFSTVRSIPGGSQGVFIGTNGSGQLDFGLGGSSFTAITDSVGLSLNTWYYITGVRSGNTLYLFKDGVLVGTASAESRSLDVPEARIGSRFSDTGQYFTAMYGNIDEVRVTRGVARYTSNFAVPTEPFPNS
jgi:hypothetical protein